MPTVLLGYYCAKQQVFQKIRIPRHWAMALVGLLFILFAFVGRAICGAIAGFSLFIIYAPITILGILLIFIITLIMLMPTCILMYVQIKSQLGALEGDPLGIPAYFTPLFLLVMTLTFFFYIYVIAWWGFSFTYLYGAIETQEKEKKERLQAENQEHDVVHHIQ